MTDLIVKDLINIRNLLTTKIIKLYIIDIRLIIIYYTSTTKIRIYFILSGVLPLIVSYFI